MANRKKIPLVAILAMLLFTLSACAAPFVSASVESPVPTPCATPAPSPSPTPEPVIAVFGADDSGLFAAGIEEAARGGAYAVEFIPGGLGALSVYRPKGAAAAIVYLADSSGTLPSVEFPLYVFSAGGYDVSDSIPHLAYLPRGTEQAALESAISYPPHLAPVRMIGLFTSTASQAYALWTSAQSDGEVFAKREYIVSDSEESLSDWLTDVLSRYFPGMLDAVYAETGELAVVAAERLASLGRDDIEVFSAGTDADAIRALSPILVCAVGIDLNQIGVRCYLEASNLLSGRSAESGTLSPELYWYSPNP